MEKEFKKLMDLCEYCNKSIILLTFVADLNSILDFGEQLLSLEPPLSENDYSFALGTEEGISDLFDFKF